jgi:hypothetical protein
VAGNTSGIALNGFTPVTDGVTVAAPVILSSQPANAVTEARVPVTPNVQSMFTVGLPGDWPALSRDLGTNPALAGSSVEAVVVAGLKKLLKSSVPGLVRPEGMKSGQASVPAIRQSIGAVDRSGQPAAGQPAVPGEHAIFELTSGLHTPARQQDQSVAVPLPAGYAPLAGNAEPGIVVTEVLQSATSPILTGQGGIGILREHKVNSGTQTATVPDGDETGPEETGAGAGSSGGNTVPRDVAVRELPVLRGAPPEASGTAGKRTVRMVENRPEAKQGQEPAAPAVPDAAVKKTVDQKPVPSSSGKTGQDAASLAAGTVRQVAAAATARAQARGAEPAIPVQGQDVVDQLVRSLTYQVKENVSSLRVVLKPESLGEVVLHVRMENGGLTAQFDVSNPQTRTVLEANLPGLRQELSTEGIHLQRIDIGSYDQASSRTPDKEPPDHPKPSLHQNLTAGEADDTPEDSRSLGYNTLELIM